MRVAILAAVVIFLSLWTSLVSAARPVLGFGQIKSSDMVVVLGTLKGVAKAQRPWPNDPTKRRSGFQFVLLIDEVLRTGGLLEGMTQLDVPFSPAGYATNWEFGAAPENGMMVIAHLAESTNGKLEVHPYPRGIMVLEEFNDPVVKHHRRILRLMDLEDSQQQLQEVLDGARGTEGLFAAYCVRVLQDIDGTWTGVDLSTVIEQPMALSHLFNIYLTPDRVSLEAISACDNVFWNTFRGRGFELQPPRHEILTRFVRRAVKIDTPYHHSVLGSMLEDVCEFSDQGRENLELIHHVLAEGAFHHQRVATMKLAGVYRPHTKQPAQLEINIQVWKKLLQLASDKDPAIADEAGVALGRIATEYAAVGPIPDEIQQVITGESKLPIHERAQMRMESAWQDIQKSDPVQPVTDAQILASPWDDYLDKKVFTAAKSCYRDGEHGASVEIRGRRLWVEGLGVWPSEIGGNAKLVLTGTLTKKHDLPVFRFKAGEPLQAGLPVPEGYSLTEASTRYVLQDATWSLRESR